MCNLNLQILSKRIYYCISGQRLLGEGKLNARKNCIYMCIDDAGHYMERCVSPINGGGDVHWKCRR